VVAVITDYVDKTKGRKTQQDGNNPSYVYH